MYIVVSYLNGALKHILHPLGTNYGTHTHTHTLTHTHTPKHTHTNINIYTETVLVIHDVIFELLLKKIYENVGQIIIYLLW